LGLICCAAVFKPRSLFGSNLAQYSQSGFRGPPTRHAAAPAFNRHFSSIIRIVTREKQKATLMRGHVLLEK
jgi:hypothetical protein